MHPRLPQPGHGTKKKRFIAFNLDGALAQSKQLIDAKMDLALSRLT
jgi:hypothetical protein